jgi:hypothetical protein
VFIDDDMGNEYSENDFVEKFNYCVQETDIWVRSVLLKKKYFFLLPSHVFSDRVVL